MSQPATQTAAPLRRQISIQADSSGKVPDWIQLLQVGEWSSASNKGHLVETLASLGEYKRNFDAGISQSKDDAGKFIGLPIDYTHNSWDKAAGWIQEMKIEDDSLIARVDWTPAGAQAIIDGEFKCFSPSWYPANRGDWEDPEDPDITARNVIVGGGLTNIPFFKGLPSLIASNTDKVDRENSNNLIFIQETKEQPMTLDEVRVLEASALNDEQKKLLEDNKAELSAEELTKFGLEASVDTIKTKKEEPVTDPELAAVNADIKSGKSVVINAATYEKMQSDIDSMKREKVEAAVTKHVERGAIKADQIKDWTDRIVKDDSLTIMLEALPDNPVLADALGSSSQGGSATAHQQLHEKAEELVTASQSTTPIKYEAAFKQAMHDNPDLTKELNAERE